MRCVHIRGSPVYYQVQGSGPPLDFLHGGFGGDGTELGMRAPTCRNQFAQHLRLIRYDWDVPLSGSELAPPP